MKELTLEITQYCPHNCNYCSSCADIHGSHLSYEIIRDFLIKRPTTFYDIINISGGEPLAHPNFYQILMLAKENAKEVWVYSNVLDHIRFNADILPDGIECHANVILKPGSQIPKADGVHFLQLINQGRAKDLLEGRKYHISGLNCKDCDHVVLQADGKIVSGPCKKKYKTSKEK